MTRTRNTQCAIAGGGPAGIMLGFLLARAGISVVVLEKWPDFFRDFRGDTIHPSTMELMHELGCLEEFLELPHEKTKKLAGIVGDEEIILADFSHLATKAKFIAFVPQWDFLTFITSKAKQYEGFKLLMETEVKGIWEEEGTVKGIRAQDKEGEIMICADLVVGADGRHSTVRDAAKLTVIDSGVPLDVLWFRLSRNPEDHAGKTLGRINEGTVFIMINRREYWQCGYVIPKGGIEETQAQGIEALRARIARLAPEVASSVEELRSFDDIKLLSVSVDHLKQWSRPGLLTIGDAAHAMSPVGGVGINLAIQDAVAAANILVPAFRRGGPTLEDLEAVQKRRAPAARLTQRMQVFIHTHVIARVLRKKNKSRLPLLIRIFRHLPYLQRIPARLIGIGFRPEHIQTLDIHATPKALQSR